MLRVRGIEATSPAFRRELVAMAGRLGADPDAIAAVMAVESGMNPAAKNPISGASGLIQFMPSTAKRMGTTVDAIRQMSREAQLPIVERFFRPMAGKMKTPTDTYMAVFMPAFVGSSPDLVLFTDPEIGYVQNKGLDRDGDGRITVGDVGSVVEGELARARIRPPIDDGDGSGDGGEGPPPAPSCPVTQRTGGGGVLLVGIALAFAVIGLAFAAVPDEEPAHAT